MRTEPVSGRCLGAGVGSAANSVIARLDESNAAAPVLHVRVEVLRDRGCLESSNPAVRLARIVPRRNTAAAVSNA